jgi:hypothetical protein
MRIMQYWTWGVGRGAAWPTSYLFFAEVEQNNDCQGLTAHADVSGEVYENCVKMLEMPVICVERLSWCRGDILFVHAVC